MKKPPARWRDLHPGDMIIERIWTEAMMKNAADWLKPEGYCFKIETTEDGEVLITCLESPQLLIGDRPCN